MREGASNKERNMKGGPQIAALAGLCAVSTLSLVGYLGALANDRCVRREVGFSCRAFEL